MRTHVPRSPTADASKRVWAAEPRSFIGLTFGEALSTQVQEAPLGGSGCFLYRCYDESWRLKHMRDQYFTYAAADLAELNQRPDLGEIAVLSATVGLADNTVAKVTLTIRHLDWLKAADLLKAKFGEPRSVVEEAYSTAGGQDRTGSTYTWAGDSVTVRLSEYGAKVDEALITATTSRWLKYLDRKSKENAEKYKSKL